MCSSMTADHEDQHEMKSVTLECLTREQEDQPNLRHDFLHYEAYFPNSPSSTTPDERNNTTAIS